MTVARRGAAAVAAERSGERECTRERETEIQKKTKKKKKDCGEEEEVAKTLP